VLLMYLWSALVSAGALAVGLIDGRLFVGMLVAGLIIIGAGSLFVITALPRFAERRGNGNGSASGSSDAPPDNAKAS
jgi:hypothetical protein